MAKVFTIVSVVIVLLFFGIIFASSRYTKCLNTQLMHDKEEIRQQQQAIALNIDQIEQLEKQITELQLVVDTCPKFIARSILNYTISYEKCTCPGAALEILEEIKCITEIGRPKRVNSSTF